MDLAFIFASGLAICGEIVAVFLGIEIISTLISNFRSKDYFAASFLILLVFLLICLAGLLAIIIYREILI